MKKGSILGAVSSVTVVLLLSKLLGFGKQMVVAAAFGATIETDLINLSQTFIGNLHYLLMQALSTSFVTVYLHTVSRDPLAGRRFAAGVLKAFTLVAVGLTVLVAALSGPIAGLIAPSYDAALSARLAGYLRLYAPVLTVFVWTAVFQALLTANRRFLPGEMVRVNQSVILVLAVLVFQATLGPRALVVGFFAYSAVNVVYLGLLTKRHWSWSPGNPFTDPDVRQLLNMMGPLLLGCSLVYVNQQVDKILVSGLGEGVVTSLGYAAVLSNLVGAFIATFGTVLFSHVTGRIAQGREEAAIALANRAAALLCLVFLPVSILTVLCAGDVVSIVYGRGAFDAAAVQAAAQALAGYGLSFVPFCLCEVYSRVHYGYQDTRRPMVNSSIGITCNIALSIALCPRFGVAGVAFASSVSSAVYAALNLYTVRRHAPAIRYGGAFRAMPLVALAAAACVVTARWALVQWQGSGSLFRFLLTVLCAGGVYFLLVSPLLWRLARKPQH